MPSKKIIDLEGLKKFRQEADQKYVIEGEYSPTTSVGKADVADNLTPYGPNSGADQDTPFVFQSSGGGSDIGSIAQLRELRGNSVVFNQRMEIATTNKSETQDGITLTDNRDGSYTLNGTAEADTRLLRIVFFATITDHKYLIGFRNLATEITGLSFDNGNQQAMKTETNAIFTSVSNSNFNAGINVANGTQLTNVRVVPQVFDLTQMFGAGNEPTSVLEFNRLFPKAYYSYNSGTLMSCNYSGIKNVGYNAFDGVFRQGSTETGNTNAKVISSTNPIRVIAGQTYTFEAFDFSGVQSYYIKEYASLSDVQSNTYLEHIFSQTNKQYTLLSTTQYIKIQVNFNENTTPTSSNLGKIAFHLTWDNSRTGYEPYIKHEYSLPNVELRKAGSAYDELKPDGTLTRRIGVAKLKDLTYTYVSAYNTFVSTTTLSTVTIDNADKANIICSKYNAVSADNANTTNKAIGLVSGGYVRIRDTSYTDATTFKNALTDDDVLYYELATPTTEQYDAFVENQAIDDFGTQEYLPTNSALEVQVPQGCYFFYPVDYKAFIDSLGERNDIDYDASKVVSQTQLQTAISQIPTPSIEGTFNVINASDIVNNTLTQAQYDLITNGKPTLINGTILGIRNPILTSPYEGGGGYIYGLKIGQTSTGYQSLASVISQYKINVSSKAIETVEADKRISLEQLYSVNGKSIPDYPSSTGTFVLKCIDGTLTWVQE